MHSTALFKQIIYTIFLEHLLYLQVPHEAPRMIRIYKKDSKVKLEEPSLPNAWTNFYRSDDLAATAYFYLNCPGNDLPDLQPMKLRTWKLK